MSNKMSEPMTEFINRLDLLCFEFGYEIWPTDVVNKRNNDGSYPTFTIHGQGGEKVKLTYVDGDGNGK